MINSLINSVLVCENIFTAPPRLIMVEDGAFSHKIDYVTIFQEILNPEAHPNRSTGSKVTMNRWICLLEWGFSGEGSVSAACAEGLFLRA